MLKDYFKKFFKKFVFTKGVDSSKIVLRPYRHWKILVAGFFVALVISIGLNLYLSVQIINNNFLAVPPSVNTGPMLNREGLTNVLADFATKEAFLSSPATTSPVVDPSR